MDWACGFEGKPNIVKLLLEKDDSGLLASKRGKEGGNALSIAIRNRNRFVKKKKKSPINYFLYWIICNPISIKVRWCNLGTAWRPLSIVINAWLP